MRLRNDSDKKSPSLFGFPPRESDSRHEITPLTGIVLDNRYQSRMERVIGGVTAFPERARRHLRPDVLRKDVIRAAGALMLGGALFLVVGAAEASGPGSAASAAAAEEINLGLLGLGAGSVAGTTVFASDAWRRPRAEQLPHYIQGEVASGSPQPTVPDVVAIHAPDPVTVPLPRIH